MILLTGFDAFAGLPSNPSATVVRAVAEFWAGKVPLRCAVLPTVYGLAEARLRTLLEECTPAAVVLLGVARSCTVVQLERVALNLDDSQQADNHAERRLGVRIVDDGPVGYWSTLDLERWQSILTAYGIETLISNHAGTFLCNHVFYTTQAELARRGWNIPCGFVHVPGNLDAAGGPTSEALAHALIACLETVAAAGTVGPVR